MFAFNDFDQEKDYKYPMAPDIIDLEEHETFKDTNNNIINIEVRGERKFNKCYFRLADVSIGFNMPSLYDTFTNKDTHYLENIHYKYFSIDEKKYQDGCLNDKNYSQNEIFVTYKGMLKFLFSNKTHLMLDNLSLNLIPLSFLLYY